MKPSIDLSLKEFNSTWKMLTGEVDAILRQWLNLRGRSYGQGVASWAIQPIGIVPGWAGVGPVLTIKHIFDLNKPDTIDIRLPLEPMLADVMTRQNALIVIAAHCADEIVTAELKLIDMEIQQTETQIRHLNFSLQRKMKQREQTESQLRRQDREIKQSHIEELAAKTFTPEGIREIGSRRGTYILDIARAIREGAPVNATLLHQGYRKVFWQITPEAAAALAFQTAENVEDNASRAELVTATKAEIKALSLELRQMKAAARDSQREGSYCYTYALRINQKVEAYKLAHDRRCLQKALAGLRFRKG